MEKKVYTKQDIKQLLLTNDKAVDRAILALYNLQTQDEKGSGETLHSNKVGFSGADGKFGSYLARYILLGNQLSGEYKNRARNMVLKYVGQLVKVANKNLDVK